MSLRGLLVLIGLLAAAIVLLLRVGRQSETPAPSAGDAALLRAFTEATVRAIDLDCDGARVSLARADGPAWRIVSPFAADADPRRVREVLSALQDARAKKVVSEKGSNLAGFGLAPAACTVRLDLGSAGPSLTLRVGRTSPVSTERYAAAPDGRVVLTEGSLFSTVSRGAEAFREKRLIPAAAEEMTRIVLSRPDGRMALAKIGDQWQVESPRRDTASSYACESLARAIAALEIEDAGGVPPPTEARPERRIEIRVAARGIERPLVAQVAAAGVSGRRIAWREGAGAAGLLEETAAGELERPVESFFEKRIASFSLPEVREVVIVHGGTTIELARTAEDAPWTGREGGAAFDVEGTRVIDFLNKIRSLTASGFEREPPQVAPSGQIKVRGGSGELAHLTYGPLGPGVQWVVTPRRPGAVFRVDESALGAVPGKADLVAKP